MHGHEEIYEVCFRLKSLGWRVDEPREEGGREGKLGRRDKGKNVTKERIASMVGRNGK